MHRGAPALGGWGLASSCEDKLPGEWAWHEQTRALMPRTGSSGDAGLPTCFQQAVHEPGLIRGLTEQSFHYCPGQCGLVGWSIVPWTERLLVRFLGTYLGCRFNPSGVCTD